MSYKINQSIKVFYRAVGAETGITDLEFVPTNPSGSDQSSVSLTEVSGYNGLYSGSFTPDAYGIWWIRVKSTTNSENVYAESYIVGENKLSSIDNKIVTVTTDGDKERLDVSTKITGTVPINPESVSQPVHYGDGHNNNSTKISYTVPTGKILHIQRLWASHSSDAVGHTIAFRDDGTQFYWMSFNNDGNTTFEKIYPDNNSYIMEAGEVLTAYRISGSSPESWTAGFDGYLEDV